MPEHPPIGWDCHVHVFEAAAPLVAGHYRPSTHSLAEIETSAAAAGVGHLVLVQPSVYGTDNSVLLRALRMSAGRHRGVVVIDPGVCDRALDDMHEAGVRGVRFNLVSPVGNGDEDFSSMAPRLRERGWHAQWYASAAHLPRIAALHASSGLTCVLDHLGGLGTAVGMQDPAWLAAQVLARSGAWIKLSGWYRLGARAPYEGLGANIRRAAGLFAGRMVWGSDWPHTSFTPPAILPDYRSVWHPVPQALGTDGASAVMAAGAQLYG